MVKGGRYDKLLKNFGNDAPAIGFAVFVDRLQTAIDRQKIHLPMDSVKHVLLYEKENRQKAITVARRYRDYGKIVLLRRITETDTEEDLRKEYAAFDVEVVNGDEA